MKFFQTLHKNLSLSNKLLVEVTLTVTVARRITQQEGHGCQLRQSVDRFKTFGKYESFTQLKFTVKSFPFIKFNRLMCLFD